MSITTVISDAVLLLILEKYLKSFLKRHLSLLFAIILVILVTVEQREKLNSVFLNPSEHFLAIVIYMLTVGAAVWEVFHYLIPETIITIRYVVAINAAQREFEKFCLKLEKFNVASEIESTLKDFSEKILEILVAVLKDKSVIHANFFLYSEEEKSLILFKSTNEVFDSQKISFGTSETGEKHINSTILAYERASIALVPDINKKSGVVFANDSFGNYRLIHFFEAFYDIVCSAKETVQSILSAPVSSLVEDSQDITFGVITLTSNKKDNFSSSIFVQVTSFTNILGQAMSLYKKRISELAPLTT